MVLGETASHAISLEIYLPSIMIGGTLITRHHRVSSHLNLRSGDETLLLKNVKIEDLAGNCLSADCKECLLCLKEVLFIAKNNEVLGDLLQCACIVFSEIRNGLKVRLRFL